MRTRITKLLLLMSACAAATAAQAEPQVRISTGMIEGKQEGRVAAFLGLPYASPPTGADRWRAPKSPMPWEGVRQSAKFGASCPQNVLKQGIGPWTHEFMVQNEVSEDCLFLNVWTPAAASAKLPVIIWIHGGAWVEGSGAVPIYDGRNLAERGAVVISINYRLGILGFFAHPELTKEAQAAGTPPANFGWQDQIAALKWVKQNIAAFGGDPDQVTIAGQSAGSLSVQAMVVSPMAKGLFKRGIAQSGYANLASMANLEGAERNGTAFAKRANAKSLAELRAMTPAQLLATSSIDLSGAPLAPSIDGMLLPAGIDTLFAQGRFADVPLMIGQNADEGSFSPIGYGARTATDYLTLLQNSYGIMADRFASLYPAVTEDQRAQRSKELLRDRGLASMWQWSQNRVKPSKSPVYGYLFSHAMPGPETHRYSAFHTSEVPYALSTLDAAPERNFSVADNDLSHAMSEYWLNFAKNGDPNGPGLPVWPRIDADHAQIMEFGDMPSVRPILPGHILDAERDYIAHGGSPKMF